MPAPKKSLVTIPDEAIKRLRSLERLVWIACTTTCVQFPVILVEEEQIGVFSNYCDAAVPIIMRSSELCRRGVCGAYTR